MHQAISPEEAPSIMPRAYRSAMVIDDDTFSQAIFSKRLEQLGISDICAADHGYTAVRMLDTLAQAPDLIICDLFMPNMDGIELLQELAKRHYRGGLILVTGVNMNTLMVAYELATIRKLKVLGSFTKPVSLAALAQALGISLD